MMKYFSLWSSLPILVPHGILLMLFQPVNTFECMRSFIPHNHYSSRYPEKFTTLSLSLTPTISATRRQLHYGTSHNFRLYTSTVGVVLKSKSLDGDEQSIAVEKASSRNYNDYKEQLEALSFLSIMGDDSTLSQDDDADDDGIPYLSLKAQSIFDEMYDTWVTNGDEYEDLEPSTEIYNLLIDVYAHARSTAHGADKTKGIEIADSILQKMEDAARSGDDVELPLPDIDTYFSVMDGWAKHNNFEKVHSTFQRLKRYHHHVITTSTMKAPHAESYNTLLHALMQSDIPSAAVLSEALLREMIGIRDKSKENDDDADVGYDGKNMNNPCSSTMTKDELQKLTVKRLKEMIAEMNISNKASNVRLKADIVEFILQQQDGIENTEEIITSTADKDTDVPDPNTRSFYLVLSCILRHPVPPSSTTGDEVNDHGVQEKVQEIVDLMTDCKNCSPNTDVNPQHTSITNVRIKVLGQKRKERSNGLVAAEEAESLLLNAMALYQREGDLDMRPDAASFINAINVWRGYQPSKKQKGKAARRAMDLLHVLEDFYVEEKSKSNGIESGGLDKLKPDYRVYNAVQYVWARSRSKDKANETRALLDKMISLQDETGDRDYSPNKRSYNNVINACTFFTKDGNSNDSEECQDALRIAVQTFNDMRASDEVDPDHVTYGMLLKAVGTLMAENNANRDRVTENIFRKCCKDGHVSEFVLESFTTVSNELLYEKIIGAVKGDDNNSDDDADSIYIPIEWSKNIIP